MIIKIIFIQRIEHEPEPAEHCHEHVSVLLEKANNSLLNHVNVEKIYCNSGLQHPLCLYRTLEYTMGSLSIKWWISANVDLEFPAIRWYAQPFLSIYNFSASPVRGLVMRDQIQFLLNATEMLWQLTI